MSRLELIGDPKILAYNECRPLAMGQYHAGDGKTYSIAKNVWKEIIYFAKGSANAYSGFYGSQITCTGGTLQVDGIDVDQMVMYVTEEFLSRDEKYISREDDDGIIAQYNYVRLTCPAEDNHCIGGVDRRFLVGYNCSKPMDVKPVSSFIHDHCEPVEASKKETYDIQPVTQFQIVQYETRSEFLGTRCEKYVSLFTYYCRNADHASPLPQETFFRRSKILAYNECRSQAMGQYRVAKPVAYRIVF